MVFVIWFVTRFFKLQQEKNQILKNISDNLEKLNKTDALFTFERVFTLSFFIKLNCPFLQ